MSTRTIPSLPLPENVLEKVFKYVDQNSLKNIALTCKAWKEIVERSSFWSLDLSLQNNMVCNELCIENLMNSKRKFGKLMMEGASRNEKGILKIVQQHGRHMQEFFIHEYFIADCDLDEGCIFMQFLKAMPGLKKVVMFKITTARNFTESAEEILPKLRKLKTLEMIQCNVALFLYFKKAKLQTLVISDISKSFAGRQKDLSVIPNGFSFSSHLFEMPIEDASIPLEQLFLGKTVRESPDKYLSLLQFMQLQLPTINALVLGKNCPEFIYEMVFGQFKNLNTLVLFADSVLTETDVLDRLERSENIKSLTLFRVHAEVESSMESTRFERIFMKLSRLLPNLETLSLNGNPGSILAATAGLLTKMKSLSVENIDGISNVIFPALTRLKIREALPGDWNVFTQLNPNIAELIFAGRKFDRNEQRNLLSALTRIQD